MSERSDSAWWQLADRHLIRYGGEFNPVLIERASGTRIYDRSGRSILDFTSGQMCAILGHNHPAVVAAMSDASENVLHLFSGMLTPDVIAFAEELAGVLPDGLTKSILLSTGSESNEAAFRLAKLVTGGFEVVAFAGSWHGMTAAASSSTYSAGHRGYGPAMPGTMALPTPNSYRCPIQHCSSKCDLACLDAGMSLVDAQSVGQPAAIIAEPVLSAGGIVVLPEGYLARLRDLAHERGYLLILDEAQTALGRLGSMFGFELHDVVPDILTLSKTLGAGLPVASTVTSSEIEEKAAERGFLHFTSHVSDPLAARVARVVLSTVIHEGLSKRAGRLGEHLRNGLVALQERHEMIGDVRGAGLLQGVELVKDRHSKQPAEEEGGLVTERCLELGLNLNIVKFKGMGSVLRIAPPLTVSQAEIDEALGILDEALTSTGR